MIKIENTEVLGWKHAIRGMRNPLNSWDKSDSFVCGGDDCPIVLEYGLPDSDEHLVRCDNGELGFCIGRNDLDLMKRLVNAGSDHRKFMRMIVVYTDIVAPLYWWKEFDTYKVGTVRNSCSTMHRIHSKEFEIDDFSTDKMRISAKEWLHDTIDDLNQYRHWFIRDNDKDDWWQLIQMLPSSYNQRSTVMLNYEVLANMYHSRKNHKLDEWKNFCRWVETLPYSELITGSEAREENV